MSSVLSHDNLAISRLKHQAFVSRSCRLPDLGQLWALPLVVFTLRPRLVVQPLSGTLLGTRAEGWRIPSWLVKLQPRSSIYHFCSYLIGQASLVSSTLRRQGIRVLPRARGKNRKCAGDSTHVYHRCQSPHLGCATTDTSSSL